jgi:hypothetical protein
VALDWLRAQSVEVERYPSFSRAIASIQEARGDEAEVEAEVEADEV